MDKKKIVALMLATSASAGTILLHDGVTAHADEHKVGYVVNVETNLRVRSKPNTDSNILGYLRNGEKVNIIKKVGAWYEIDFRGQKAYAHGDYIKEGSNNSSPESSQSGKGKVVNVSSSLRIRSGAGTNNSIVGYLYEGNTFDILEKSGSWYKINSRGTSGYIHSDYVKIVGQGEDNSSSNNSSESNSNVAGKRGQVINISSNLRVRNAPSTSSSVVAYLLSGQTFDILGKSGSWYKIKHNGTTGYVHQDYVKIVGNSTVDSNSSNNSSSEALGEYGKVVNVSTSLRLRQSPSTSSSVVGYLFPGETFKITARSGSWYKVNANGKVGYASSEYIKIIDKNEVNSSGSTSTSASFETVFNILKQQIGSPYIWGGKGEIITHDSLKMFKNMFPDAAAAGKYNIPSKYINNGYRAFDCSGLLYWGFRQIGINIGGSTYSQINAGREVSLNDVRPGDLLFYGNLQHVGMYIGNGQWIEAPKSHDYVKIASVPWSRIGRARRILN